MRETMAPRGGDSLTPQPTSRGLNWMLILADGLVVFAIDVQLYEGGSLETATRQESVASRQPQVLDYPARLVLLSGVATGVRQGWGRGVIV